MRDSSVFDRLARTLSGSERQRILDQLHQTAATADLAPRPVQFDESPIDYERAYRELGVLQRIWVAIRSFFSGQSRTDVVAEQLLSDLAARLRKRHGDLVDPRSAQLLGGFSDELVRLRAGVHAFSSVGHAAWNGRRVAFLAFLVGVEMPEIQERLLSDTNPSFNDEPDIAEFALKQKMHSAVQFTLDSIPRDEKSAIARTVRFLDGILELAKFDFGGFLRSFEQPDGAQSAPFYVVREPLTRLAALAPEVLVSPSDRLLEALVLFEAHHSGNPANGVDVERLASEVQTLSDHLKVIWDCVAALPLLDLCRLVRGDVNWRPTIAGGADTWIADVRRFWRERVELIAAQYQFRRRKLAMVEAARSLGGEGAPKPIVGYPGASGHGEGRHSVSLGVAEAVVAASYHGFMRTPLRTVVLEGEFYKEANRDEFTQACANLDGLVEAISGLRARCAEAGDVGLALTALEREDAPEDVRAENRRAVIERLDADAHALLTRSVDAFRVIADVLYGILYGEIGGRYDTLANLGSLGGRSHAQLMRQLDGVMHRATDCRKAIGDLMDLEQTIARRFRDTGTVELTAEDASSTMRDT